MKKSFLTLGLVAAGVSCLTAYAAGEQDRINTLEIKTTEDLFFKSAPSIHVVDIDSIEFRTSEQKLKVWGFPDGFGYDAGIRDSAIYDLSQITGFEFTYLKDGVLPAPSMYGVLEGRNSVRVGWRPIAGAAGYEVRCVVRDFDPNDELLKENIVVKEVVATQKVGAEESSCLFEHLPYESQFHYQIRTLSPKGEGFHSDWSCRRNFKTIRMGNYFSIATDVRYDIPAILTLEEKGYDYLKLKLNLEYDAAKDTHDYAKNFEIKDGKYVADKLIVKDGDSVAVKEYVLSDADKAAGEFTLSGLEENHPYFICLYNSNVKHVVDAPYNQLYIRTKGHPLPPEVIESEDITSKLSSYQKSDAIPEGQVYYLHGDKEYSLASVVDLSKGMRLATLPEDVAAGKRAKVTVRQTATVFMLGESYGTSVTMPLLAFEDIDFNVLSAFNYSDKEAGITQQVTGNYFLNRYSTSGALSLDSLVIRNCSFQGFVRGFVRIQGANPSKINNFLVEGCDFYNCGYYDENGRGYAWVAGHGNVDSNIFNNMVWRDNTIYNYPRAALFSDNDKNLEWPEDVKWNITLENNTFVNFSTVSNGRNLFQLRYLPGGSKITAKNNLFIQTKDEADTGRALNFYAMDMRQVKGSGKLTLDIRDNYCNGSKDDGIVTNGAFSSPRNSAGAFPESFAEGMTEADLVIKAAGLEATELMAAPNPPSFFGTPDAFRIKNLDGLYYNDTEKVRNSEVFTKKIGASKWREGIGSVKSESK